VALYAAILRVLVSISMGARLSVHACDMLIVSAADYAAQAAWDASALFRVLCCLSKQDMCLMGALLCRRCWNIFSVQSFGFPSH
jgi:hypothetical protein